MLATRPSRPRAIARWQKSARNAYRWFLGKNELGMALGDIETGECFDGLIPTGVNRNRGAESILAFHLATVTIQRHQPAFMLNVHQSQVRLRADPSRVVVRPFTSPGTRAHRKAGCGRWLIKCGRWTCGQRGLNWRSSSTISKRGIGKRTASS